MTKKKTLRTVEFVVTDLHETSLRGKDCFVKGWNTFLETDIKKDDEEKGPEKSIFQLIYEKFHSELY
jgi:hypothetical protein